MLFNGLSLDPKTILPIAVIGLSSLPQMSLTMLKR